MWNLTNRSANKASECYFKIIGRSPVTPCLTRWNSQFDAINQLLKQKDKLSDVFKELKLPCLQSAEIDFPEEFQNCLKPIAICLDKLQGDTDTYMGDVIPSIFAINHKLQTLLNAKSLKFC